MNVKSFWKNKRYLRSILYSIFFNFHYLPFRQAIHLPILLYKPRLLDLKGQIKIDGKIKCGMIKLGFPRVPIYPNSGIMFQNLGGAIVFKGSCDIGNNSSISIGENAMCVFGERFSSLSSLKLVCFYRIMFGKSARIGWDCFFLDTDFHKLSKLTGGYSRGFGSIIIGDYNWFGNGCLVMKRTKTPNYCTVSARTTLDKELEVPEYSIIGNTRDIEIKAFGFWRNIDDDVIEYS